MKTAAGFIILLLMLFSGAYMIYVPYQEIKVQTIRKLNEKQMLLARQAAVSIQSFFADQSNRLRDFASDPDIISMTEKGRQSFARSHKSYSRYIKGITRFDERGVIIYSYPNPRQVEGISIAAQPHVQKMLQNKKSTISDVFTAVQGFTAIAVSEPVFENGRFAGAVAFLIDFKYIARTYIEGIRIGGDGYAWMISRDGTELYCPVPGHIGVNVAETSARFPSVLAMAEDMKNGYTGYTTYTYDMSKNKKTQHILKYAVYTPVKISDNYWSIVVATPESEILSELAGFFKKMITATAVLLFSAAILGYIMLKDFHLRKINKELAIRVEKEMEKRKNQEKLMLQQARFYSMGETLNAIAHQWRQPLNAVGLCIQDLEDAYKMGQMDEKYLSDTVAMAMRNLEGLSEIIDEFRNFYSSGEENTKTNLCTLISIIYGIMKAQLDACGISFVLFIGNRPVSSITGANPNGFDLVTKPGMLKQVLMSILQNAKEAIEINMSRKIITKGEINLFLSVEGEVFKIEITDNGGGIKDEIMDKIFDPYFSTKNQYVGMGLGLYAAKSIMEEHLNGSMKLVNKNGGVSAFLTIKSL